MITYGEAKKILSKYIGIGGKCPSSDETELFVKQVLQYLLLHGTYGNERKFVFCAQNHCITLPPELETPLKIKIDGQIGSVWSRWFEYKSGNDLVDGCTCDAKSLLTEANRYPTVYDLPSCGGFVGVTSVCEEAPDAHVIIKGVDLTGREIYTDHQGQQIVGEYLSIKKGQLTKSSVKFGKIREVYKTLTKNYVTLLALDECGLSRQFLSDYAPWETTPSYQRARILFRPCPNPASVSILGRIRLKDHYADEDIIPFDNIYLLSVAGQTINKMYNDDVDTAIKKDQYVQGLIETEGNYKKVNNGQPLEIYKPLSGGAVTNANRASRFFRRFGRIGRRVV